LRNTRAIILTLIALVFTLAVCGGLVFLLAGDEIMSSVRTAFVRFSLAGREDDLQRTVSTDATPIRFTVNGGDSPATVAANLLEANLITDSDLFVDYVRAERLDVQLEAGTYFLNQAQTIPQIAQALTDSRFSQITFTVIPGWRLEQVVEAIDANPLFSFSGSEFYALVRGGAPIDPEFAERVGLPQSASLEGFLFPDTYQLAPETTPEMLVETLTGAFLEAVSGDLEESAAEQGRTLYEIVTMASIVQREAIHIDEQPKIAGVYYNRLNIDMMLEADPTVQYGLDNERGSWWAAITRADYQGVDSPYNTYRNRGLPPGPIANPSINAIRASIYPEESEYFYFRADCRTDGYHEFARTYTEHLENGC
jgi:UPF0755 protein